MKLALYLPNFRDEVTVKELEDLTALAEDLDFDSVWTLDRIVVPEASDRARAAVPVRDDDGIPHRYAGHLAGRVVPGHDADPLARREDPEGPDRHEHHRHPVPRARRARRRARHPGPPVGRRLNVGVGAGWMPEEFAAASAPHLFPRRHAHVRETIEIMQGIWTNDLFEYHGEFADFPLAGSATNPSEAAPADLLQRTEGPEAFRAGASRSTASRAGSASRTRPEDINAGAARSSGSWASSGRSCRTTSTCAA